MIKIIKTGLICLIAAAGVAQAAIISNDFSSGSVTKTKVRVYETNVDQGWVANSTPPSAWMITNGVLQNTSTVTTVEGEGAVAQIVSYGTDTNGLVKITFDYVVASGDTLYVHFWGLNGTYDMDGEWIANFQTISGVLTTTGANSSDGVLVYNMKDGSAASGTAASALVALTGSGTYSNSINIASLGASGVTTAGDFEYYLLGFAKDESGAAGGTSVDNIMVVSTSAPPVIPPSTTPIVWENDMSIDPASTNWIVRGTSGNYTMGGGLLTMTGATLLDSDPFDNFMGFTKVDLVWRATSYSTDENALGVGVWCNVNNDLPDYGAINFHSVLLSNDTQTVKIYGAYNSQLLVTIPGFSTNMLTLSAVIDSLNSTIAYQVTDGITTNSDTISYTPLAGAGTRGATLFNLSPTATAEVDYVRVEANIRPAPGQGFMLAPNPVSISLLAPASLATGTVSVIYGSATNMVITSITVGSQSHPGSLSTVTAAPQTLDNASAEVVALTFKFDNDVAALEYGTATGLVTVVWTEEGSGVTNNTVIPISAAITLQSGVVNAWTAGGNGVSWGDAANWNLGRIPGVYAADQGIIQGGMTVAVATNYIGAFPYSVTLKGNSTAPTLNISANLQGMGYMWLGRDADYWGFVNQTAGVVTSGALSIGDTAGTAASNSVYTLSGGTHTVGTNVTVYAKGELDISSGALAMNGALNITNGGIVKLTGGTMTVDADANGGTANLINIGIGSVLEINGGAIFSQPAGRVNNDGILRIVGDSVTVNLNIPWADCTGAFEFVLDETGVSTITNKAWGALAGSTFKIDGAAYAAVAKDVVLYSGVYHATGNSVVGTYAVTNLGTQGVDWTITESLTPIHTVTLNILTSHEPIGYESWAAGYNLSGVPSTVDVDGDGLVNLMEYALGGNPVVDDAAAVSPVSFTTAVGGTNWFYYVHNQRTDDATLVYTLGTETDLVNATSWNTNDVVVVGESATVSHYKSVTNRTATVDSAKFLKLTVEQP